MVRAAAGPRAGRIARAWVTPAENTKQGPAGLRGPDSRRQIKEPTKQPSRAPVLRAPVASALAYRSPVRSPRNRHHRSLSRGGQETARSPNAGNRRENRSPSRPPAGNADLPQPRGSLSRLHRLLARLAPTQIEQENGQRFNHLLSLLSSGRSFVFSRSRL